MNTNLDKSNLRKVILESVEQIHQEFTIENFPKATINKFTQQYTQSFDEIIVSGMGGSALPSELLLSAYFQLSDNKTLPPVFIHRSYGASRRIRRNSLVMVVSYSGNTEETLSAYETALEESEFVIAMAAGGKLIDKARELNKPFIILPQPDKMFQPRYATLYILKAMLTVLVDYKVIDAGVKERLVQSLINVTPADFEEKGKEMASLIKGKTPVIYTSNEYKTAALLWKIKINENAKTPCFWNYFPELNHNEMVGFTNPQAKFQFVLLNNESEAKDRCVKRMQVLQNLFEGRGLEVKNITVKDYGNHLANLVSMILIGDWTAYYLALEYGIDPTPVDMVEEFKELMKG